MGPLARAGIVFGLALALAGCGGGLSRINTVDGAPQRMEKAAPALFQYRAADLQGVPICEGRAFAIDRRRVLTARHSVLGRPRHFVRVGDDWTEAELLGADEYADAALLKLPADLPFAWQPFDLAAPVESGAAVQVAGHAGRVEGLNTAQLDAPLRLGDSGSPVVLSGTARAVGILRGFSTTEAAVGHFTDAAQINAWLATLRK